MANQSTSRTNTRCWWAVSAHSDVEAAYASALAAEKASPGGDPSVITDGMIPFGCAGQLARTTSRGRMRTGALGGHHGSSTMGTGGGLPCTELDRQMIGAMWTPGHCERVGSHSRHRNADQGDAGASASSLAMIRPTKGRTSAFFRDRHHIASPGLVRCRVPAMICWWRRFTHTVDGLRTDGRLHAVGLVRHPGRPQRQPAHRLLAVELARWTVATTDTQVNPTTIQRAAQVTVAGGAPPGTRCRCSPVRPHRQDG